MSSSALTQQLSSDQTRARFHPGGALAHFNSQILPNVGVISPTSYALANLGENIGAGLSSGYVEFGVEYPQGDRAVDATPGTFFVFELNDQGSNSRYFSCYIADHRVFLDLRDSAAVRNIASSTVGYVLPFGFNVIRWTSNGSSYSLTVNGAAVTVDVGTGSDDGKWTGDLHAAVDTVTVGAISRASVTASFVGTTNAGKVSYIDFDNKNKWIFNDGAAYVYDTIGGKHIAWTGAGSHATTDEGGSTYPLISGYSLWELASNPDIYVPYSSVGAALSLTPGTDIPASYAKTKDVAGSTTTWNSSPGLVSFRECSPVSDFVYGPDFGTADLNTASGTRTWFMRSPHTRIGATGKLRQLEFFYAHSANTSSLKFQVWRYISTTYTLIHNVDIISLLPTDTGIARITLADALDVVEGDFMALSAVNSSADNILKGFFQGSTALGTMYSTSEEATGYDWPVSGTDASANLTIRSFVDSPVIACVGDSIMAGRPGYAALGEGGFLTLLERTNQIPYHVEALDSTLTYANFGVGAAVLSAIIDQVKWAIRTHPSFVLLNGGTNDIAGGETNNTTIVTDYEAIVDDINAAGIPVIACSVIPYPNGTNAESAQIDALNALLSTMMASKDGIFVDLTVTVGLFRSGGDAGNLWDLQAAYDADGVHMTVAGSTAAAGKIHTDLIANYTIGDGLDRARLDRSGNKYASAASQAAASYDSGNPYRFDIADLSADMSTYFGLSYSDTLSATISGDNVTSLSIFLEAATVNVIKAWRGAVEPAELGPSGNEIKTWRGAIEPVGVGATSRSIYGVSFDVTRNVTRGVTESWSNR